MDPQFVKNASKHLSRRQSRHNLYSAHKGLGIAYPWMASYIWNQIIGRVKRDVSGTPPDPVPVVITHLGRKKVLYLLQLKVCVCVHACVRTCVCMLS